MLNSRQRRKAEARKHNRALAESAAYQEDRARDPEKYKPVKRYARNRYMKPLLMSVAIAAAAHRR